MKQTHAFLLSIIAFVVIALFANPSTTGAKIQINGQGDVIRVGQVLGKSDQNKTQKELPAQAKANKPETTDDSASAGETEELEDEVVGTTAFQTASSSKRNTPSSAGKKSELKVRVADDVLEFDNEDVPEATESDKTEVIEILPDEDQDVVKLRGKDNAAYVIRNKIAAQSRFPLSVNLDTNELMVTTPKGTKIVTVLPDKAVANMLAANVLDQLGGKGGLKWLESKSATPSATPEATDSATPTPSEDPEATPTATLSQAPEATEGAEVLPSPEPTSAPELEEEPVVADEANSIIELVSQEDGTLAYEIEGAKSKKLFGFYPVSLQRKVTVSAETGEVLDIDQSFTADILEMLSTE
jgi:hypothetical protein